MKNLFLFALLVFTGSLYAQNPVSNVKIRLSDEQDKVTVYYDLARSSRISYYNIKVSITLDGEKVDATGLTGDFGPQVTAGLGKKILWDVHQDVSELSGELKIEVTTDTKTGGGGCVPIKTLPAYAGLGGVAASGAAMLIGGLTLENDSQPLYDTYSTVLDPNDPVYDELSREEHYSEANSKHKKGQWLMIAGGATLVAGGVIFVSRLIKINNYNRRCREGRLGYTPKWDLKPSVSGLSASPGVGLSLTYTF